MILNKGVRDTAVLRARNILNHRPIILDTETTGLDDSAEIVDIALVSWEGNVLFQSLVKPANKIPATATAVHDITDAMVEYAPRFDLIWHGELREVFTGSRLLAGQPICTYNADYDYRLLQQTLRQYSLPITGIKPFFCIMELYAEFHGEWNNYHHSYRWQSLENAAWQCGLGVSVNAHRAAADCLTALKVLRYMAGQKVEEL